MMRVGSKTPHVMYWTYRSLVDDLFSVRINHVLKLISEAYARAEKCGTLMIIPKVEWNKEGLDAGSRTLVQLWKLCFVS
jgi:hypothetical protein